MVFLLQVAVKEEYNIPMIVLITITCLGTLIVFLYTVSKFFYFIGINFIYNIISPHTFRYLDFRPKTIPYEQEQILIKHFSFYNKLSQKSKLIFQNRLVKFMKLKTFETREGLLLTDKIKTLISASAIQLTFGLSDYKLKFFKTFIIYPQKFLSKKHNRFHLGETNANGVIAFSWFDFEKGYADGKDNFNLGLHEFAHALIINFQRGLKNDYHFENYYQEWKEKGHISFFDLRKSDSLYIRDYAQTNLMEFFAVCVECFFETPEKLKQLHPDIFNNLRELLAQDPSLLNNTSAYNGNI